MNLHEMMIEVHTVNVDKGWFDDDRTFGDMIALLHSEVSEALEAYRDWKLEDATALIGNPATDSSPWRPKPQGVGSEMADVLIRLLDMAYRYDIDLEQEYVRKVDYNRTRPHRHGGRVL